jgi:hypothetical protein
VILFVHRDGQTQVASEDTRLPERDATLVFLAPAEPAEPSAVAASATAGTPR